MVVIDLDDLRAIERRRGRPSAALIEDDEVAALREGFQRGIQKLDALQGVAAWSAVQVDEGIGTPFAARGLKHGNRQRHRPSLRLLAVQWHRELTTLRLRRQGRLELAL